jgi:hypothetical protein
VCLIASGILMSLSLALLAYAACADYAQALEEKKLQSNRNSRGSSVGSMYDPRAGCNSDGLNCPYYQNVHTNAVDPAASRRPGGYLEGNWSSVANTTFTTLSSYPAQPPSTNRDSEQEYLELLPRHPVSTPFTFLQQPPSNL